LNPANNGFCTNSRDNQKGIEKSNEYLEEHNKELRAEIAKLEQARYGEASSAVQVTNGSGTISTLGASAIAITSLTLGAAGMMLYKKKGTKSGLYHN